MNTSKKRVLTEQVRRLRGRFAQSVDRLLGEVIPAELLKQWVLEGVVQWREGVDGSLRTRLRLIDPVKGVDHGCQEGDALGICDRVGEGRAAGDANPGSDGKARG